MFGIGRGGQQVGSGLMFGIGRGGSVIKLRFMPDGETSVQYGSVRSVVSANWFGRQNLSFGTLSPIDKTLASHSDSHFTPSTQLYC